MGQKRKTNPANNNQRRIAFAFSGGGVHGVAHLGFLDEFFNHYGDSVEPVAFSGTSAGAMTAVQAALSYKRHGHSGITGTLKNFWHHLRNNGANIHPGLVPFLEHTSLIKNPHTIGRDIQRSPFIHPFMARNLRSLFNINGLNDTWSRAMLNPMGTHHLFDYINHHVDFAGVNAPQTPRIFINAYDIKKRRNVVFDNKDINAHTLAASGTLPFLWKPVRYKEHELVDGLYGANPPLHPLIDCDVDDIYVLNLGNAKNNPMLTQHLKEIEAILAKRRESGEKTPRIHVVTMDIPGHALSKFNSNADYMNSLERRGRQIARQFISQKTLRRAKAAGCVAA